MKKSGSLLASAALAVGILCPAMAFATDGPTQPVSSGSQGSTPATAAGHETPVSTATPPPAAAPATQPTAPTVAAAPTPAPVVATPLAVQPAAPVPPPPPPVVQTVYVQERWQPPPGFLRRLTIVLAITGGAAVLVPAIVMPQVVIRHNSPFNEGGNDAAYHRNMQILGAVGGIGVGFGLSAALVWALSPASEFRRAGNASQRNVAMAALPWMPSQGIGVSLVGSF